MTGLERIKNTMAGKPTDKTPWVPFAGVHAGKLVGYTAREVSTDIDKLEEALKAVNKYYNPDGQPIMFDLQIEAEILGCELVWSEDAPPSVKTHPLGEDDDVPTRIPEKTEGRLALELEAVKRARKLFPDTALYGVNCGPFTLASHLRGTDIFMDMIDDPDKVMELLDYTANVCIAVSKYLIEAGCDVVAVTDPLISQISPSHFEEFMMKPFSKVFDSIKEAGGLSAFFVCGDATRNLQPMCETHPNAISVDENVKLPAAKAITDAANITLSGNIPLTSIMLFGNQLDNMKATIEMLDSIDSTHHYIVSPGCDMPYDIPLENTIGDEQAVHNTDETRAMVSGYTKEDIKFEGELPDYEHLEKPLVEVFTLDSATCAACTYMKASAVDAVEQLKDGSVDLVEYKYTVAENIARCKAMNVTQLPSIYINGKLRFSSIIPNRSELLKAIEEEK
jgi:uroporphyrinogen decarboxylase